MNLYAVALGGIGAAILLAPSPTSAAVDPATGIDLGGDDPTGSDGWSLNTENTEQPWPPMYSDDDVAAATKRAEAELAAEIAALKLGIQNATTASGRATMEAELKRLTGG